jgi:hypothetical protein
VILKMGVPTYFCEKACVFHLAENIYHTIEPME